MSEASDLRQRVLGQARDVLQGEANGDWRGDWPHEWAQVLLDLVEQYEQAKRELAFVTVDRDRLVERESGLLEQLEATREAVIAYMVATDNHPAGHPNRLEKWHRLHELVYDVSIPATGYRDEDSGVWIDDPGPQSRKPNPASKPPDTRTPEQVMFDEQMEAADSNQESRPE